MKRIYSLTQAILLIASVTAIAGCTAFQLYDAKKSEIASAIKTKYTEGDILGTIELQKQNLAALSSEELKAVRENLQIQRDFALLEIVDNDTPMGLTWIEDVEPDIQRLGLDNPFKLRAFVQAEEIRVRVRDRQLDRLANLIQDTTQVVVEKCDSFVIRPSVEGVDWPTDRNAEILNRAKERYKLYLNTCEKMLNKAVEAQSGALVTARANLESAKSALDKKARDVKIATADVKKARQDHKQAIIAAAAAGKRGEELRIAIKESADNLKSKIDQASTLAPSIVTTERISGIVALLEAAASDRVDLAAEDTPNENLAEAILLVNGISSLASDIATIVAKAEAPSISNLLIELQHQVVLLEYAQALERMEQEKVAILEAKYLAHKEEAVELLSFHDALCTFGIRTADGQHPGIACTTPSPSPSSWF